LSLIISLILVNGLGFLLRYYDYDRFVIILGFRFHLSLVLPFIVFLFEKNFTLVKEQLTKVKWKEILQQFLLIFIPSVLLFGIIILIKQGDFSDPEYLYELGFSSIVDLPIYLLWNLPQLLMIGIVVKSITEKFKFSYPIVFLFLLLLFGYEYIPLQKEKLIILDLIKYAVNILLFSLIFVQQKSIYSAASSVFLSLWILVLIIGAKNPDVVQIVLAKNYTEWEGFLEFSKIISNYISIIFSGLMIILFSIYFLLNREKIKI